MKNKKLTLFLSLLQGRFRHYASFAFVLLCAAIAIRFFESFLLAKEFTASFSSVFYTNFLGLLFDIIHFLQLTLWLFPFYFLLSMLSTRIADIILSLFGSLLLLISLITILYYANTGIPLDNVFFAYSIKEIILTVTSSKPSPWWAYGAVILIPVSTFILLIQKWKMGKWWSIVVFIAFLFSFFFKTESPSYFETKRSYFTASNKVAYLFQRIREGITLKPFIPTTIEDTALEFQKYFPELSFVDPRYPLLHVDSTEDVLSPYFHFSATKPNFVFIIVEGLGREFSGPHSKLPSATPFLDSLAKTGLYWEHCFSTSQRTIGALPAIFAALPFGKRGIMTYKNNIPDFHSLIKILTDNGYDASFFYGGWLCFDDMCYFLERNQITHFLNEKEYEKSSDRTEWGLYDHALFREAIKKIPAHRTSPRIDIFLTLTTHDPFEYPSKEAYTRIYTQKLQQTGKLKEISPKFYQQYASFLYLDESLRQFFNDYRKKADFDNTIFIITGDHHFNMETDNFDIYQVPLLIWSPLLRQAVHFPALVSHRDITPSILAMMKTNFPILSPDNVAWINRGLDTNAQFQSKTFSPLMDVGRNLTHFIYHNFFIQQNEIYKIQQKNHHLILKQTEEKSIQKLFKLYQQVDLYVVENDALIENSLNSGENFVENILTINQNSTLLPYYQKITDNPIASYHGKANALFFKEDKYPMSIFSISLKNKQLSIIAQYEFSLYIPTISENNETSTLMLVTEIKRKDGKTIHYSYEELNSQWYGQFDQWAPFHFKNIFKKKNYHYQEGDILTIYIHNPNKRPFYFTDLKINLEEIY